MFMPFMTYTRAYVITMKNRLKHLKHYKNQQCLSEQYVKDDISLRGITFPHLLCDARVLLFFVCDSSDIIYKEIESYTNFIKCRVDIINLVYW